jgi:hypothetical protein
MSTATPTKPASSVVKRAAAAADREAAKGQKVAPRLRPNDAKLYGPNMEVMSVVCPRCGAKAGKPCTEPAGFRAPHKDRVEKGSGAKATAKQAKAAATSEHEPAAKS